jgi:hypothetical protein
MLYDIVTEQVSQQTIFHELLMNFSIHMSRVVLYVKCIFSLVTYLSRVAKDLPFMFNSLTAKSVQAGTKLVLLGK